MTCSTRGAMVGFAATEDSRVMNVPTRKIGPGPAAGVFVLDPQGSIRPAQLASVQIEHSARLASELGIAGEDPTTVIPGRDGVFLQPPPQRTPAAGRHQAAVLDLPDQILSPPTRKTQAVPPSAHSQGL